MFDRETLITAAVMLGVATWGGVVGYYRKLQAGMTHTWIRFSGEILSSALAGMCLGMAGISAQVDLYICMALAGIGGHLGTRFFDMGEDIVKSFLDRMVNKDKT